MATWKYPARLISRYLNANMKIKKRQVIKFVWIILSFIVVLGMVAWTIAPAMQ